MITVAVARHKCLEGQALTTCPELSAMSLDCLVNFSVHFQSDEVFTLSVFMVTRLVTGQLISKGTTGTAEVAQQLGVLAAFLEEPHLIPSP